MKVKRVLLFTFMFSYFVTVLFPAQTYASFLDVLGLESGQTYYIRNSDSGRYLEVENGRDLENQNVRTGDSYIENSPAQTWRIFRNYDGTYKLFPIMTGNRRSLERLGNGNAQIGTDVSEQADMLNSFTLFRTIKGTYTIEDNYGRYMTEDSHSRNAYFAESYYLEKFRWCFIPA